MYRQREREKWIIFMLILHKSCSFYIYTLYFFCAIFFTYKYLGKKLLQT